MYWLIEVGLAFWCMYLLADINSLRRRVASDEAVLDQTVKLLAKFAGISQKELDELTK